MFPRIYYGSTTISLNKIREEFPDLVLLFDNDVDKIINNYSKFFDSDNLYVHTKITNASIDNGNGAFFKILINMIRIDWTYMTKFVSTRSSNRNTAIIY
jgi:hypothetical protein